MARLVKVHEAIDRGYYTIDGAPIIDHKYFLIYGERSHRHRGPESCDRERVIGVGAGTQGFRCMAYLRKIGSVESFNVASFLHARTPTETI